jgi:hypothetical protein
VCVIAIKTSTTCQRAGWSVLKDTLDLMTVAGESGKSAQRKSSAARVRSALAVKTALRSSAMASQSSQAVVSICQLVSGRRFAAIFGATVTIKHAIRRRQGPNVHMAE